ncbi:MAG: hypothetical protein GX977_14250 [Firmicutes bacterium]|nr:hypothetical protein [Bacillota bacterium]
MSPIQETIHIPGPLGLRCDKCGSPASDQIFYEKFFSDDQYACKWCGEEMDLLVMFASLLRGEILPAESFYLLGARVSVFSITLTAQKPYHLKFYSHGIPEGSVILRVNYTPQDAELFPIQLHGNTVQIERFLPPEVVLYPVPLAGGSVKDSIESTVNILVTWINKSGFDYAAQSLFDALYFYHNDALEASIIPANVAVEESLNRLCTEWLSRVAARDRVRQFLESGATYSYQLNILLPLLAKQINVRPLNGAIVGKLNRLRRFRNGLAHTGRTSSRLSKEDAADLIGAAFLGHLYITWIGKQ